MLVDKKWEIENQIYHNHSGVSDNKRNNLYYDNDHHIVHHQRNNYQIFFEHRLISLSGYLTLDDNDLKVHLDVAVIKDKVHLSGNVKIGVQPTTIWRNKMQIGWKIQNTSKYTVLAKENFAQIRFTLSWFFRSKSSPTLTFWYCFWKVFVSRRFGQLKLRLANLKVNSTKLFKPVEFPDDSEDLFILIFKKVLHRKCYFLNDLIDLDPFQSSLVIRSQSSFFHSPNLRKITFYSPTPSFIIYRTMKIIIFDTLILILVTFTLWNTSL